MSGMTKKFNKWSANYMWIPPKNGEKEVDSIDWNNVKCVYDEWRRMFNTYNDGYKARANNRHEDSAKLLKSADEQRSILLSVSKHGKNDCSITKAKRYIYKNSLYSISKVGGGFTGKEFLMFEKYAAKKGLKVIPWVREAHGGGQSSRGNGVIHMALTNLVEDITKDMGILAKYKALPVSKRIARTEMLLADGEKLGDDLSVKIIKDNIFPIGTCGVSLKAQMRFNLPFAVKARRTLKCLMVPIAPVILEKLIKEYGEADFYIPKDENKFKLSVKQLSHNIYIDRKLAGEHMFSQTLVNKVSGNVGKLARASFDLRAHLGWALDKRSISNLTNFYETAEWDEKLLQQLFRWKDPKTLSDKWMPEAAEIRSGKHPFDSSIQEIVLDRLWKVIMVKLLGTIPDSIYGTLMDLEYLKLLDPSIVVKRGHFTRWPWLYLIECDYVVYRGVIGVPRDLLTLYGGDNDGDQGMVIEGTRVNSPLKWPRDESILRIWMKQPDKLDSTFNCTDSEMVAKSLDGYQGAGQVYNNKSIVVDATRETNADSLSVLRLDAQLTGIEFQKHINVRKYEGGGEPLSVEEMVRQYGVYIPFNRLTTIGKFYAAFKSPKGSKLHTVVELADEFNANPKSRVFSEAACAVFKGLKFNSKAKK